MIEKLTARLPSRLVAMRTEPSASQAAPPADPDESARQAELEALVAARLQALMAPERQKLAQAQAALEQAAHQLRQTQQQVEEHAREHMLELALHIAAKVLSQEVGRGRYQIEPVLREALAHCPPRQELLVRLNPDDFSRCQDVRSECADASGLVRFVADPAVPSAGCVVESPQGDVVSTVESNLAALAQALREEDSRDAS